jgi:hypothetical protein
MNVTTPVNDNVSKHEEALMVIERLAGSCSGASYVTIEGMLKEICKVAQEALEV